MRFKDRFIRGLANKANDHIGEDSTRATGRLNRFKHLFERRPEVQEMIPSPEEPANKAPHRNRWKRLDFRGRKGKTSCFGEGTVPAIVSDTTTTDGSSSILPSSMAPSGSVLSRFIPFQAFGKRHRKQNDKGTFAPLVASIPSIESPLEPSTGSAIERGAPAAGLASSFLSDLDVGKIMRAEEQPEYPWSYSESVPSDDQALVDARLKARNGIEKLRQRMVERNLADIQLSKQMVERDLAVIEHSLFEPRGPESSVMTGMDTLIHGGSLLEGLALGRTRPNAAPQQKQHLPHREESRLRPPSASGFVSLYTGQDARDSFDASALSSAPTPGAIEDSQIVKDQFQGAVTGRGAKLVQVSLADPDGRTLEQHSSLVIEGGEYHYDGLGDPPSANVNKPLAIQVTSPSGPRTFCVPFIPDSPESLRLQHHTLSSIPPDGRESITSNGDSNPGAMLLGPTPSTSRSASVGSIDSTGSSSSVWSSPVGLPVGKHKEGSLSGGLTSWLSDNSSTTSVDSGPFYGTLRPVMPSVGPLDPPGTKAGGSVGDERKNHAATARTAILHREISGSNLQRDLEDASDYPAFDVGRNLRPSDYLLEKCSTSWILDDSESGSPARSRAASVDSAFDRTSATNFDFCEEWAPRTAYLVTPEEEESFNSYIGSKWYQVAMENEMSRFAKSLYSGGTTGVRGPHRSQSPSSFKIIDWD